MMNAEQDLKAVVEAASAVNLANVQARREKLLSIAWQGGVSLERAMALSAAAELWLAGEMASEDVLARLSVPAKVAAAPAAAAKPFMWGNDKTLRRMIEAVSRVSGVSLDHIRSERRSAEIALARQVFCWVAATYTSRSLPQIGRFLGRYHTTIMHARKVVDERLNTGSKGAIDLTLAVAKELELDLPADLRHLQSWSVEKRAVKTRPVGQRKTAPSKATASKKPVTREPAVAAPKRQSLPATKKQTIETASPLEREPAEPTLPPLTEVEEKVLRTILRGTSTPVSLAAKLGLSHAVIGRAMAGLQRKRYTQPGAEKTVVPMFLPNGKRIPPQNSADADAMVEAALAAGRITRCPPAYVAPVAGADKLADVPVADDPAIADARARSARVNKNRQEKLQALKERSDG